MTSGRHAMGLSVLILLAASACGDDASGGGNGAALASCHAQCEAQQNVTGGCTPTVDLASCKQLCSLLVSGVRGSCTDEFSAYYDCSAADGFTCVGSLVAQKSDACQDEQDRYDSCQDGPGGTTCEGARDSGTCPQVACPCPEGEVLVSGFDNDADGCSCWNEVTCQDLTCD